MDSGRDRRCYVDFFGGGDLAYVERMAPMRYTAHVLVAGWLLAVCVTGQASAATVRLVNHSYHTQVFITFEGDIAAGDVERLRQVGEQATALGKPIGGIFLNSEGGNFGEAAL